MRYFRASTKIILNSVCQYVYITSSQFINLNGVVVKLVITSACHAEGRGFESRSLRHFFSYILLKFNFIKYENLYPQVYHNFKSELLNSLKGR